VASKPPPRKSVGKGATKMGFSKGKKLISKLGKDGVLYGAVDVPDGEYGRDELIKRADARSEQFTEKYQTESMGPGDGDGPTNADKYPTAVYPSGSVN
jgi:hypothetical protein